MKRILSLILIFLLAFTFTGCNNLSKGAESVPIINGQEAKETEIETEKLKKAIKETTFVENYISDVSEFQILDYIISSDSITDVVKATYRKTETVYDTKINNDSMMLSKTYLHHFENVQSLRNNQHTPSVIDVYSKPANYSGNVSTYDIKYNEGDTYLLIISNVMDRWGKRITNFDDALLLILDSEGNLNVENSKLYSQSLVSRAEDDVLRQALLDGTFIEYLLDKIEDNSLLRKVGSFSEDMTSDNVMENSPCVISAKVYDYSESGEDLNYKKRYLCNIVETIKGEIKQSSIVLYLPTDMVTEGQTYIIGIQQNSTAVGGYELSGYRSVYTYIE